MSLAEAVLDRSGGEFRLLIYSEFLRRYEDPEWNLKSLLEPVRQTLSSARKERFKTLEESLMRLSASIADLTTSPNANGVKAHDPAQRVRGQSALKAPGTPGTPGTNGTCSPGAPDRRGRNYGTMLTEDRCRSRSVIRARNRTLPAEYALSNDGGVLQLRGRRTALSGAGRGWTAARACGGLAEGRF
jgi:hypothetical protein